MQAHDRVQGLVQETLLGEIVDELELGLLVWHEGGSYIAANQAACDLLGYTRDELLALPLGSLSGEVEAHSATAALQARQSSGTGTLERKDGSAVEVEWFCVPCRAARLPAMATLFWPRGTLRPSAPALAPPA